MSIGGFYMPGPTKKPPDPPVRGPGSTRDAVSAVRMSEKLTAEVDAWAEAHGMPRSYAICQLVKFGLIASPTELSSAAAPVDALELEHLAAKRIGQLLDPSLPDAERERRIRRLIEGPPEFSADRIDLARPKK